MRLRYAVAAAFLCSAAVLAPQPAFASPTSTSTQTGTTGSQTSGGTESHAPVYGYSSHRVTRRVDTDQHVIALTLDDGFHLDGRMLDLVQTWGLRGTAFIVGTVARDNPDFIHRLVGLGWEVCSHTWDHKNLTTLSDYQIYKEMTRGMHEVNEVSGQHCPYFRPPYGAVDSRVIATADNLGLKIINWDASLSDSTTPDTKPQVQTDIAFRYLRPGSILLGHWGGVNSYEVLKAVLTGTLAAGYQVGTVTELLEAGGITPPAAALPPTPVPTTAPPTVAPSAASSAVPTTAGLSALKTDVPVLRHTKKVSNRVGFIRLAAALAVLFFVLLLLRARARRRMAKKKAAQRKLAHKRQREHSHQR
jgi:peptidoglycan/xylan/chitin deacetylase (PgdA/CDA1 family)